MDRAIWELHNNFYLVKRIWHSSDPIHLHVSIVHIILQRTYCGFDLKQLLGQCACTSFTNRFYRLMMMKMMMVVSMQYNCSFYILCPLQWAKNVENAL